MVIVDYAALNNADETQLNALEQQLVSLREQGYRVTMPLDAQDCPKNSTHRLSLIDSQWQLLAV